VVVYLLLLLLATLTVATSSGGVNAVLGSVLLVNAALVAMLLVGRLEMPGFSMRQVLAEVFRLVISELRRRLARVVLTIFLVPLAMVLAFGFVVVPIAKFVEEHEEELEAFAMIAGPISGGLAVTVLVVGYAWVGWSRWHESRQVKRYLRGGENVERLRGLFGALRTETAVLALVGGVGRSPNPPSAEVEELFDRLADALAAGDVGTVLALEHSRFKPERKWLGSAAVLDEVNIVLERSRRKAELGATRSAAVRGAL
jgi:hypothetical protein